jgi:hypothetical protein
VGCKGGLWGYLKGLVLRMINSKFKISKSKSGPDSEVQPALEIGNCKKVIN